MKSYYTEIHGGRGSQRIRREAARAEEWIRNRVMSFATDLEYRDWLMRGRIRQWSGCTACSLHRKRKQIVLGAGTLDPLLLVIYTAPGAREDEEGRAFLDPPGKLFRSVCRKVGIDLKRDAFLTQTVACRPHGRKPEKDERARCQPRLVAQAEILQPCMVLLVGRTAMKMLHGISRSAEVNDLRGVVGKEYWPDFESSTWRANLRAIFVTQDPALILAQSSRARKKAALGRFVEDMRKVKRVLDKLDTMVERLT